MAGFAPLLSLMKEIDSKVSRISALEASVAEVKKMIQEQEVHHYTIKGTPYEVGYSFSYLHAFH